MESLLTLGWSVECSVSCCPTLHGCISHCACVFAFASGQTRAREGAVPTARVHRGHRQSDPVVPSRAIEYHRVASAAPSSLDSGRHREDPSHVPREGGRQEAEAKAGLAPPARARSNPKPARLGVGPPVSGSDLKIGPSGRRRHCSFPFALPVDRPWHTTVRLSLPACLPWGRGSTVYYGYCVRWSNEGYSPPSSAVQCSATERVLSVYCLSFGFRDSLPYAAVIDCTARPTATARAAR